MPAPARALIADGEWRRLVTDPVGSPLALSTTAYRPPAALRRWLAAGDATCTAPFCPMGASGRDVDHPEPWPAGRTSPGNCHAVCRRHHRLKTLTDWEVVRDPTQRRPG